jgi:L-2-hydroxyglutarate oxidase LhgO
MDADVVVIGAGVVGLAVASEIAGRGRDVLVLEAEPQIGSQTSSRNSEVIHAGIYYPQGSLKARWCVEGKQRLYEFCEDHAVPYRRLGKLIVAVEDGEIEALESYYRAGMANGAGGLHLLDAGQVRSLEPGVRAVAGLLSDTTGIVDSHALMVALQGRLEAAGGMVAMVTPVIGGEGDAGGVRLSVGGQVPSSLRAEFVVNCAGLSAPAVAASISVPTALELPASYYAIGHYYSYTGRSPFARLVYPVAGGGGLGVHATIDLGGAVRFGPDVRWLPRPDYSFDDSQRLAFVSAIKRYYPGLDLSRLHPGYTGIRPKITAPNDASADFMMLTPSDTGSPLVHLLGIESPGLTASLAIGRAVADFL